MEDKALIREAFAAQQMSYAPYSGFCVGAALLAKNGSVYRGCNIENAAFSAVNCAERTAFFKAISEGVRDFTAIAVVGNKKGVPYGAGTYCAPCGVCRQVMQEFCDPEKFRILLAKDEEAYQSYTLSELLPLGFSGKNLED